MILYDIAYFGLYGNTVVCPTCKATIEDRETCVMVPTLDGMTVHCLRCGEMIDKLEEEWDE